MIVKKRGAPRKNEEREVLTTVCFKVDGETLAALVNLERAYGIASVRGSRSTLLRKLILDARSNNGKS